MPVPPLHQARHLLYQDAPNIPDRQSWEAFSDWSSDEDTDMIHTPVKDARSKSSLLSPANLEQAQRSEQHAVDEQISSENSHPLSELGRKYLGGLDGFPKDEKKALELLQISAEQGDARGQAFLGVMHLDGRGGLTIDEKEALKWFQKSAGQGDGFGLSYLGTMHYHGQGGLPKDEKKAVEFLEKSAQQEDARGQVNLGIMREYGKGGLQKNKQIAFKLYTKSAAQKNYYGEKQFQRLLKENQRKTIWFLV